MRMHLSFFTLFAFFLPIINNMRDASTSPAPASIRSKIEVAVLGSGFFDCSFSAILSLLELLRSFSILSLLLEFPPCLDHWGFLHY